jgi:ribosome-binding factor A
MKTPKRRDDVLRALCAQVNEDDGFNPRLEKKDVARRGSERKDWQLCKQVLLALAVALQSEAADNRLRDIEVVSVDPDPDASRMRVGIRPHPGARVDLNDAIARLRLARGFLRSCVGEAISRKRVPELVFAPAPPRETEEVRND